MRNEYTKSNLLLVEKTFFPIDISYKVYTYGIYLLEKMHVKFPHVRLMSQNGVMSVRKKSHMCIGLFLLEECKQIFDWSNVGLRSWSKCQNKLPRVNFDTNHES